MKEYFNDNHTNYSFFPPPTNNNNTINTTATNLTSLITSTHNYLCRSEQEAAALSEMQSTAHNSWLSAFSTFYEPLHGYAVIVVCIVGIASNILNIVVLTRRSMSSPTNFLLSALALSDLVTMLANVPYVTHFNIVSSPDSRKVHSRGWVIVLMLYVNFSITTHTVSMWFTVLLALFRYIVVCYPVVGPVFCTLQKAKISVSIVIITTILLCTQHYIIYKTCLQANGGFWYEENVFVGSKYKKYIFVLYSVVLKIAPCAFLSVLSGLLLRVMSAHKRKRKKFLQKKSQLLSTRTSYSANTANATKTTNVNNMVSMVNIEKSADFIENDNDVGGGDGGDGGGGGRGGDGGVGNSVDMKDDVVGEKNKKEANNNSEKLIEISEISKIANSEEIGKTFENKNQKNEKNAETCDVRLDRRVRDGNKAANVYNGGNNVEERGGSIKNVASGDVSETTSNNNDEINHLNENEMKNYERKIMNENSQGASSMIEFENPFKSAVLDSIPQSTAENSKSIQLNCLTSIAEKKDVQANNSDSEDSKLKNRKTKIFDLEKAGESSINKPEAKSSIGSEDGRFKRSKLQNTDPVFGECKGSTFRWRSESKSGAGESGARGGCGRMERKKSTGCASNLEKDRTTVMLVVVVLSFVIVEFPQGLLALMSAVDREVFNKYYVPLGDFMDLMVLINSAVNFVLYCSMSAKFRTTFQQIFLHRIIALFR